MAIDKNMVIKEAQKLTAKGQYDKAIAEWKKLLKETPTDANLYNTIGDLCIKRNAKAEAVDAYKRAADILADDGFTSKAIALYKKVLNIDSTRVDVHLALGDMHAEKGLTGNAVENYKYAADQYKKANKTAEALGIYQKVADLNPSNVAFRIKLADMYAKEGMTAEATGAYLAAADVHLSKEALKDARQLFEKILSIDPNNKAVYYKAGLVYLKEGKFGEACKALKPAFENDPDNRELSDTYLDALTKAGRDSDAEQVIIEILDADSSRIDLREKLYQIYMARSECGKALDTALALSRGCLEKNDHVGAEEVLKKFVTDCPRYSPGLQALAELYVSLGRGQDAANTHLLAAQMLSSEGDLARAATALSRALEIVPNFQAAKDLLDHITAPVPPPPPPEPERVIPQAPEPALSAPSEPADEGPPPAAFEEPVMESPPDVPRDEKDLLDHLTAPVPSSPPIEPERVIPQTPEPALSAPSEPAYEGPRPAAFEEPVMESPPDVRRDELVAEVQAAAEEQSDPSIAEELIEADVLVKYGLATKASEQLEGLARRFPENMEVRVKLRDLYGDQGQMRKAAAHMLIMADLYAKRGMQDQAEQVLRSALEIDPSNAEVRSRLGAASAPDASGHNAISPEPPSPPFEDLTPPADLSLQAASTEIEPDTPMLMEARPGHEPAPTAEIVIEGLDAGLPRLEEEPPFTTELPPANESPWTEPGTHSDDVDATGRNPEPRILSDGPPSSGLEVSPFEDTLPAFDTLSPEIGASRLFEEEQVAGTFDTQPAVDATPQDVEETMSQITGEPVGQEAPEPAVQEPAATNDIGEIWAEAEFYFQQGLFNEAKKHYARIVELNPGEMKAIDRLAELSREEEDTKEFTKLAEAVEGLEDALSPEKHAEMEMPFSESDEEAVRSLMKEIAQLKQPPKKPTPPAPEEIAAPAQRPAEPSPEQIPLGAEQKSSRRAAGPAKPDEDEDFFDLGAELAAESSASAPPKQEKQSDDFFDLASELRDELNIASTAPRAVSSEEQSLDEIFEEFKRGVENQSVKEDADTHYNLGVAYREMGLVDDAIAEFVMTPESEPKFIQSRYMLGLCYMEKGDYQKAIGEMQSALDYSEALGEGGKDLINMHYDLGFAYQGAGNIYSALKEFQKVQSIDPRYRDIAIKLQELKQGDHISLNQLKDDIGKEISAKFLEEGERIEREEKNRKSEKTRH